MIRSLDEPKFFNHAEQSELHQLGLVTTDQPEDQRLALATLMLAPVLEISTSDGATTSAEFETIEIFVRLIEEKFELCTREDLEELGTTMGMVPHIQGDWPKEYFQLARNVLSSVLNRLPEEESHEIRNALALACIHVANASGGIFQFGGISDEEETILGQILTDLNLRKVAEGLHLAGKLASR